MTSPDDPAILFVCTANQCRSPIAEFAMRTYLEQSGVRMTVTSAGTYAVHGAPLHPKSARALASLDIPARPHAARQLDVEMVGAADLVLTASSAHRREVGLLAAAPVPTFTLLQFARLAREVTPSRGGTDRERLVELVDAVQVLQQRTQPRPPGADDVPDPIGRWYRTHRSIARMVADAVADVVQPLRSASS